ncbi:serine-rich coiled-coil domain-containing protein 1 isoform X1 [Scleropages formosus]|nr:serine-rich coiled-coil domain-containing protein 1 isoform X1 [Scleropages formosus]XP_029115279.1 serine-rich coiled-coil domain-containing protein 1 isoform X1 [Scleropages formosus]
MGETGPRRSTLVSRLPIFRRSVSKRQDSLPSSPSSGGVANGVHTSSPSSTNSSSSSTGKRRSLFRAPSISFHSKRSSEPRVDPAPVAQEHGGQSRPSSEPGLHRGEDGTRGKARHSFGFGGHRQKKITRSQTEDFEKGPTNRGLFINCISSGANEGDDSGFLDDYSSKRSSRHKKQLLPKSFSSHHRFSKHSAGVPEPCRSLEVSAEPPRLLTPGSCPSEFGDGSLQSPMLSEDRTTAITPSEFVPVTEDSVSEVDALPVLSPAAPVEPNNPVAPPSQVFFTPAPPAGEKPLLPDASTVSTDCETAIPEAPPLATEKQEEPDRPPDGGTDGGGESRLVPEQSDADSSGLEERSSEETKRQRNAPSTQELRKGSCCFKPEARPSHLRKPHTVSLGSSCSPYHEVMRRQRAASEGAGGPRLHLNLKEPYFAEGQTLLQHRTSSSSSKLGSLDVLNNLGSSELDEDDLMLDLDLSDDQRQHRVSREDSSQSLASCLALLNSPMEPSADKIPGKESKGSEPPSREGSSRDPARPTSLLPADWCLPRDEDLVGLEGLPFRLMLQDCTAVKTLLLRLRRTLQESVETSPASSLHSLPISPSSDKSLPFKQDPGREDCPSLLLQLKDKEELIQRLQAELDKARAAQTQPFQRADKCTQTEFASPEAANPSQAPSYSSSLRERRLTRSLAADRTGTATPAAACEDRKCPVLARDPVGLPWETSCARKGPDGPTSQIPRAVAGSSSSLPGRGSPSRASLSSDSERGPRSERSAAPRQSPATSSFTGRLGQPPRGPLSLHMYSRKNVFLQHSLHTAELQALAQQDS